MRAFDCARKWAAGKRARRGPLQKLQRLERRAALVYLIDVIRFVLCVLQKRAHFYLSNGE